MNDNNNIIKLYETGWWSPLEEEMASDMLRFGYNPHDKEEVIEYFLDIESEANGVVEQTISLFNLPVKISFTLLPEEEGQLE